MKLFIAVISSIVIFSVGGASAQPGQDVPEQDRGYDPDRLVSVIDDIEVPMEVIIEVQKDHVGYAITEINEVNVRGGDGYRARVNQYDDKSGEGVFVTYNSDWEKVDERAAPPPTERDSDDEDEDDEDENGNDDENGNGNDDDDENGNDEEENVGGGTSETENIPSRDPNENDNDDESDEEDDEADANTNDSDDEEDTEDEE